MSEKRSKAGQVVDGTDAIAQSGSDVYWQRSVMTPHGMPRRPTDATTWQPSNGRASLPMKAGEQRQEGQGRFPHRRTRSRPLQKR